ncbi:MAG: hypothetical protein ACTSPW_12155 [Promethearchaeota archaeon]
MTALIYIYKNDMVCLAMDSLSVDEDKRPLKYVTKFFLLPHLQSIICGTGSLDLVMKWFEFVQNSIVVKNVVDLNNYVQSYLKKLSDKLNLPINQSSTIYHFGVDKINDEIVGYAYRSENSFKSEKLIYSFGIKPNYEDIAQKAIDLITQKGIIPGIIAIITQLKEMDEKLELEQQVGIGGEIHFIILDKSGKYTVETIHQFSDYEYTFFEMLDNKNVNHC